MRQNLEDSRKDAGVRDSIRAIRGNIETIFWMLRNMNTSVGETTGGGGGGSSETIDTVLNLPPIPTEANKSRTVYWTSSSGGTGDNQQWETRNGKTRWYPMWFPTTKNGTPGS